MPNIAQSQAMDRSEYTQTTSPGAMPCCASRAATRDAVRSISRYDMVSHPFSMATPSGISRALRSKSVTRSSLMHEVRVEPEQLPTCWSHSTAGSGLRWPRTWSMVRSESSSSDRARRNVFPSR
jgi:hypothetical protein